MELQLNVQMRIARPVREVFEAIVDPAKISQYYIVRSSGRLREETAVTWTCIDKKKEELEIKVTRIEKDSLVSFIWEGSGVKTIVEITLHADGETASLVRIRENGWKKTDRGIAALAEDTHIWTGFLFSLKAFLEYGIDLRKEAC